MSVRRIPLVALLVAMGALPTFAWPEHHRPDRDADGVSDADDACPATPHGSSVVARGCSPLEIAQEPHLFVRRAIQSIDDVRGTLGREGLLAPVVQGLDEGRARVRGAADRIHAGDLCGGAAEYAEGLRVLGRAGTEMDRIVASRTLVLQQETAGRRDHSSGEHVTIDALEISRALIGQAAARVAGSSDLMRAPCAAVGEERIVRGRVVKTLDASRRIELADGRVFGLPSGRHAIYEGMRLRNARSLEFGDGTGILLDQGNAGFPVGNIGFGRVSCVDLRIAPVQPFEPVAAGPYTLHHPDAYFVDPRHRLEEGMRFATVRRYDDLKPACSAGGPRARAFKRYGLRLELQYNGSALWVTLASDLEAGETPVPLPLDLVPGSATLRATEVHFFCPSQWGGPATCQAQDWSSQTYPLSVVPRFGHARVFYDREIFDLEDNDTSGWRPAQLDQIQPLTTAVIGMNLTFKARGCRVLFGASSCDNPQLGAQDIGDQDTFAIYNADFYDPADLFPELVTGVEDRSGLMWPRVAGIRNGKAFWYSARPPKLVRDAVDFCPGMGEDTFYRLPFFPGSPLFSLSNGNWPGHCNGGAVDIQQCPQRYAFDFPDETQPNPYDEDGTNGETVRAARGGVVTHVKESTMANQWDCFQNPPPGGCDNGNRIHIRHDDGSYGAYWHFKGNQIYFAVGDIVHRGDVLGRVGSTGNSSTAHLHFHVQPKPTAQDPGLSIRVRFQTANATCQIPQVGGALFSNNDPSLWD